MIILGVNVDHVATVREARKTFEPDPVEAAFMAEKSGARCITVHLREDRRHIHDRDVHLLRQTIQTKMNLEMSMSDEIIALALKLKPDQVTLVPEKRQELTTEGGLDAVKRYDTLKRIIKDFKKQQILVSLFVDPVFEQIQASADCGADFVELHTGEYANAKNEKTRNEELLRLNESASLSLEKKLRVNAGHGLTYHNVQSILTLPGLEELHIGHSIISRAVIMGMERAVKDMMKIIRTESTC